MLNDGINFITRSVVLLDSVILLNGYSYIRFINISGTSKVVLTLRNRHDKIH
jgi:hypothetical protein